MRFLFSDPTILEWKIFALFFLILVFFVLLAEYFQKKNIISAEFSRKFVHIFVGIVVTTIPYFFTSAIPAIILSVVFILINYFATKTKKLHGMHSVERETYGTTYFPLAFLILILWQWESDPYFISISMLVLAIGDALASIIGERFKNKNEYNLTGDKKTLFGSIAMFISTFVVIYFGLKNWITIIDFTNIYVWLLILLISFFVTSLEGASSKGLDNLFIPLAVAFSLENAIHGSLKYFIDGNLFGIIIAYFSVRLGFLNFSGGVGIYILATIIYSIGGWMWTLPIFVFFILSSLISKIGKSRKSNYESLYEKTHTRDIYQVFANGGVAAIITILSFLFPSYKWYLFYLVVVAVVTNDTWGTEIGGLSKTKPRLLLSFKKVDAGISGAVTFLGTFGGAIGGLIIILVGNYFVNLTFNLILVIFLLGILGSIIDSILGATLQMQFKCKICNKQTERKMHCGENTNLISGIVGINNDAVNILSTIITFFIATQLI